MKQFCASAVRSDSSVVGNKQRARRPAEVNDRHANTGSERVNGVQRVVDILSVIIFREVIIVDYSQYTQLQDEIFAQFDVQLFRITVIYNTLQTCNFLPGF